MSFGTACVMHIPTQTISPYNYLGTLVMERAVQVQKLILRRDSWKTINDFQKLLGVINLISSEPEYLYTS